MILQLVNIKKLLINIYFNQEVSQLKILNNKFKINKKIFFINIYTNLMILYVVSLVKYWEHGVYMI